MKRQNVETSKRQMAHRQCLCICCSADRICEDDRQRRPAIRRIASYFDVLTLRRFDVSSVRRAFFAGACVLLCVVTAAGQSLDDLHDEERYLRGLTELQLAEVLERYLEMYPPPDAAAAVAQQQHLDRLALRDAARSAAERERIAWRMIARYDELFETHPNDPGRAGWLANQASDLYFELMMIDTSVWIALLGVPSPEQEHRVRRAAAEMLDAAERAERAALEVMFEIEAMPNFADDLALQSKRRRLVEEERERRVPFLRGIAMHLHARFGEHDRSERERMARQAAETLNDVIPRLDGRVQREALVHAGFARLLEGDRIRAAEQFARVRDDEHAMPLLRFAAAVGEAQVTAQRDGDEPALDALTCAAREIGVSDQVFYQLLIADQRVRLDPRNGTAAYQGYLELIDRQPAERREPVRRAVLARLEGHVHRFERLADTPMIVRIAHAAALADRQGKFAEAVRSLEVIVGDTLPEEPEEPEGRASALALLVLGRLQGEANQSLDAARTLLTFARSHRADPEASIALESALAHAAAVYRQSPAAAAPVLRSALDELFTHFPQRDTINHWRLVAGRLAMAEYDFDRAMEHFALVSSDSEQWPEARFLYVESLRRSASGSSDAGERYERLLALAGTVAEELSSRMRDDEHEHERERWRVRLALLRVYRAEAHLAMDDPQAAIDELDAIETEHARRGEAEVPARLAAEMLPVRIQAYEAMGRADLSAREIDRLLGAAPERALNVLLPMVDAAERRVQRLMRQHQPDEALELARRELLPLARQLDQWHDRYGLERHELAVGRRLADALRHSGEHDDALAWYDRLLSEHPDAMPLLLGRAECLFALGQDGHDPRLAEAMTLYRRIAAAANEQGGEPFWLSQLRMLQILDRIGRNTERILPRIQQLRQRDAELGGDYFRRQFEQLQSRYAR
jgi:tetratricopeptide (TPR) repeat protein